MLLAHSVEPIANRCIEIAVAVNIAKGSAGAEYGNAFGAPFHIGGGKAALLVEQVHIAVEIGAGK